MFQSFRACVRSVIDKTHQRVHRICFEREVMFWLKNTNWLVTHKTVDTPWRGGELKKQSIKNAKIAIEHNIIMVVVDFGVKRFIQRFLWMSTENNEYKWLKHLLSYC